MKTFQSYSFGCRVNYAEKEALDLELSKAGLTYVESNPDVYIINTCSVTHKAEREARQHINQIRKKYPKTKLVVTGCAVTNWKKTNRNVQGIDLLIDNQNKEYTAQLLLKRFTENETLQTKKGFYQLVPDKFTKSARVFIKIQDGCHRFCTFCIVPYLRGLPKSHSISQITNNINSLKNIKEVILTAINTEAFGKDTNETFTMLIQTLLEDTKIPRYSFGSIHPWSIDNEFISNYKHKWSTNNRFVDFFHVPLQSGSNKILTIMKRGYTREEFIEKLHVLAEINPFVTIATDVIVGFLQENGKDFEDTYSFLEQTPISRFHVFRYSQREHTAGYYLAKRLKEPSSEQKKARSKKLRDLSRKKYVRFQKKHVGETFSTLFLHTRKNEYQFGLLQNQLKVLVKTPIDMTGKLKHVKITEYKDKQLLGKIV